MQQRIPIDDIIGDLLYQVAAGKAHMDLAERLTETDPVVLNAARTFFAMTIDAHLFVALMYAARIHDDQRNATTIHTLLERAAVSSAKHGTATEVLAAINSAKHTLKGLGRELKRLNTWRNRRLAHNQNIMTDPAFATMEAKKESGDLRAIYEGTGKILNEFSRLYRDVYAVLDIIGQDDYATVLEFVSDAKCRQAKEYEREFGEPAPFPRPRNCH